MIFNSAVFAQFFFVVYVLYLALQRHLKIQNWLLLIASAVFYGAWDWRFLFLIFFTITVDFTVAKALDRTASPTWRRWLLGLAVGVNMGVLGFFKYFDFFVQSFERLLGAFGFLVTGPSLGILLPVGISFYTFQSMSYVIDVYRKRLEPARHWVDYAAYVSYFPQLVAGPIERATHLLPQILKPRVIRSDDLYEGSYLILWGLYKKMFVADNLARLVDPVFAAQGDYNGIVVLLALYAFAFQIYCDFSGYSDIARGLGKCMGFDIMNNFNLPYFATNPRDFWRRWHISLSTWLRDYLYIPLGGNAKGPWRTYRNLMITMLLGGLWHGAQWTFVFWGAYHAVLLVGYRMMEPFWSRRSSAGPGTGARWLHVVKIVFFFHLVCLGWVFFRAQSMHQAVRMLGALGTQFHAVPGLGIGGMALSLIALTLFLGWAQGLQYVRRDPFAILKLRAPIQGIAYLYMFYAILLYGVLSNEEFIYFQF
ncbi:MAG: MBOAT family O-acyltransferase [Candidatus Omnitrophota bacterium]